MLTESAEALEAAEARAPGSLEALAGAYRAYALAHPPVPPRHGTAPPARGTPAGLENRAALPLLRACAGDLDQARAVWADPLRRA